MKFLLLIIALIVLCSCQSDYKNPDNSLIKPYYGVGKRKYDSIDFIKIDTNKPEHELYEIGREFMFSEHPIFAYRKGREIAFAEPKDRHRSESSFKLSDGKLEIINHGEFGGALNFISSKNPNDTTHIFGSPVLYVFRFNSKIYFINGIAMSDRGGYIFELTKENHKYSYKKILALDSGVDALTIHNNKIFIASCNLFTVVEDFKKKNLMQNEIWLQSRKYSVVAKNDEEIIIGMNGGYSILNLTSNNISYYRYKGEKSAKTNY